MTSCLQSAVTIEDLRRLARKRLPDFLFAPMDAGAGEGAGCARNVRRLREHLLVPRALVDVSQRSQATTVFGREYASAFGISAVGYAGNFRRNADLLLAESARAANVPFILSGAGTSSIESVARVAPDHVWYQLYGPPASVPLRSLPYVAWELIKHPGWALEFVLQGGPAKLESWAQYSPEGASAADIAKAYAAQVPSNQTWKDLEHIRALWPGKLVVKGLLHPDDARQAVDIGADAVTVSNHGSVKLDCMPATIDVLPLIALAVGDRIPVFFDGGIRCGPDIVVALCLGAQLGFVGRASLYGVSAGGRAGADRALQILRDELSQTLAMIGCPSVAALGPEFIFDASTPAP